MREEKSSRIGPDISETQGQEGELQKIKEEKRKEEEIPPAPPIRKKKRVKEETTDHYIAHARGKNICICQIFINFAEPQGCQGALELSHGNSGRRPALVAILCPLSFFS